MTLEEMVAAIREQARHFDTQIYPEEAEQIISALKAGQEMRTAKVIDCRDGFPSRELTRARLAWDAACKGDEG